VKPLGGVLSTVFFGVLGTTWPRCTTHPAALFKPREHRRLLVPEGVVEQTRQRPRSSTPA